MVQVFNNRYQWISKLGEGAMGEVYLVRDLIACGRPCAFKRLKGSQEHLALFKHEFRLLSRLDHPNLLKVYDFGVLNDEPAFFYTCELIDGDDLFTASAQATPETLAQWTQQILEALAYIHSQGLIHRDIKPDNIMIMRAETRGAAPARPGEQQRQVKITDFGLSSQEQDAKGPARGTIHYLAPEVIREQPSDRRADLYSLGVTLYQVLTQRLPFEGESAREVLRKHLTQEPKPPREINPRIPERWNQFVLKLLAKDPADRPPTADAALRYFAPSAPERRGSKTAFGSYLAGRFVGRDSWLETLKEAVPQGPSRSLKALTIRGSAGVGKTRLMKELKIWAQLGNHGLFMASCRDQPEQRGFERLAREYVLAGLNHRPSKQLAETHKEALERAFPGLFPELGERAPSTSQKQLYDSLARCFLEMSEHRPAVFVLEDIQWLSERDHRLLKALLRNMKQAAENHHPGRMSVFLTVRDDHHDSPKDITEFLSFIKALPFHTSLEIPALDAKQSARLITSMLALDSASALSRKIFELTQGNPLFIEELIKALLEEGLLVLGQGLAEGVDLERLSAGQTVLDVIGGRLSRIPEAARETLECLAVLSSATELSVLKQATGLAVDDLVTALADLKQRGLVQERERRSQLTQRQTRDAVHKTLSPERHRQLHEHAARALEAVGEGDQTVALAYHYDQAGIADKACQYLQAAGQLAHKQGRHDDAIRNLQRCLSYLTEAPQLCPREQRAELLCSLGLSLSIIGRFDEAAQCFQDLIALDLSEQNPKLHLRAQRLWGLVELKRGHFLDADRVLRHALNTTPDKHSQEGARALSSLARISLWRGDYLSACSLAEEALSDQQDAGRDRTATLKILALGHYYLGHTRRATQCLREALELAQQYSPAERAINDEVLKELSLSNDQALTELKQRDLPGPFGDSFGMIISFSDYSLYLNLRGQISDCLRDCQTRLKIYERLGDRQLMATCLNNSAVFHKFLGQFSMAQDGFNRALTINESIKDKHGSSLVLLNMALLSLSLGAVTVADRLAQRALKQSRSLGINWLQGHGYRALGHTAWLQQDYDQAESMYRRAEGSFRMLRNARNLCDACLDRAELALQRGQYESSVKLLSNAKALPLDSFGADLRARMRGLESLHAVFEGQGERCLELAEEALQHAQDSGIVELQQKMLASLADLHARCGSLWLAHEQLTQIQEIEAQALRGLPESLAQLYRRHPGWQRTRELTQTVQAAVDDD